MTGRQTLEACKRAVLRVLHDEFENTPPWEGWEERLPERIARAVLDAERLASVAPERVE
jgi:hypothetical protein